MLIAISHLDVAYVVANHLLELTDRFKLTGRFTA